MLKKILIKGAKEHNLKNISLEIPKEKIVVITGLSGSGKSSLAFDTLYAEGATSGRIMNLGLHPHVVGQPFRARCVREFLDYAKQFPDVWWTTREEIAKWYLKNHESHIPTKRRKGRTQTPDNQKRGRRKKK